MSLSSILTYKIKNLLFLFIKLFIYIFSCKLIQNYKENATRTLNNMNSRGRNFLLNNHKIYNNT